jgi:hypothetical protein
MNFDWKAIKFKRKDKKKFMVMSSCSERNLLIDCYGYFNFYIARLCSALLFSFGEVMSTVRNNFRLGVGKGT